MRSTKPRRNANWLCILLAAIALGVTSLVAPGQSPAVAASVSVPADRQFAQIDDALTIKVEAMIDPGSQSLALTEDVPQTKGAAKAALAIPASPPSLPSSSAAVSAASARVDLLRPAIEPILRQEGVPLELSSVVLIESGGRPTALSQKGARGLWQLMPETARRYGLKVNNAEDERLDTSKATHAAARYLHDLYAQFGNWKLALAAYNAGEANVSALILKAHTEDFDQLATLHLLPFETRRYVPNVLAAMERMAGHSIPAPLQERRASTGQLVFASAAGIQ